MALGSRLGTDGGWMSRATSSLSDEVRWTWVSTGSALPASPVPPDAPPSEITDLKKVIRYAEERIAQLEGY